MIVIVDYGLGNLASIMNMFKKIGVESRISNIPTEIMEADKLILPGVGNFRKGMENLHNLGLVPVLTKEVVENKKPVLGICLGMQLLTLHSEEGDTAGLGWIDAYTKKFEFDKASDLKIPHMGWNEVDYKQPHVITENAEPMPRYYFVHSYHVACSKQENVLGTCHYGIDFHAAIVKDNIAGVQFHPEKSHKFGMQLLRNFANQ